MGTVTPWSTGYNGTAGSVDDRAADMPTLADGVHDVLASHVNTLADIAVELETNQAALITTVASHTATLATVSPLTVREVDAAPSVSSVNTLEFPNGTLTDVGGGVVRYTAATVVSSVKVYVRLATTAALTLASDFAAGLSLDGKALVLGDRILIKDQVNPVDNGVYVVTNGVPTRATDFDAIGDISDGAFVYVTAGDTNTNSFWALTFLGQVPGVSNLLFARVNAVTAGTGLVVSAAHVVSADISMSAPLAVGTADGGASGKLSHSDHVHPLQTPTAPIVNTAGVLSITAATAGATGSVELATPAECITGTDTTRAVTPEGLKAYVDQVPSRGVGATFTIAASDIGGVIMCTSTGTGDLPDLSASIQAGKAMVLTLEPEDDTYVITINPGVGVTINGSGSDLVSPAGTRVSLISTSGSSWRKGSPL